MPPYLTEPFSLTLHGKNNSERMKKMKYVYKTVAAVGALAIVPMMLFLKLLYYKFSSVALEVLAFIFKLSSNSELQDALTQTNGQTANAIGDSMSVYDIFNTVSSLKGFLSQFSSDSSAFDAIKTPAIVLAVVFVLILICAVVTAFFAIFFKDNRKTVYSSIVGIGLCLMFQAAFESFAAPILDGTVGISTLIGSAWGDLIGTAETFTLTTNFWFVPAVFGAIILWTILYNYTLPAEEKRERKLMLGEDEEL